MHAENEIKMTGGLISPLFYYKKMIDQKAIQSIVEEITGDKNLFPESDIFIVNIKVSKDNLIHVFVDKMKGVGIDECATISKEIEKRVNREEDDYELQVSSPGIDKPFKVKQQYLKYLNREVSVKTLENEIIQGILLAVNEDDITIKRKAKSKKETEESEHIIQFSRIKETRSIITF